MVPRVDSPLQRCSSSRVWGADDEREGVKREGKGPGEPPLPSALGSLVCLLSCNLQIGTQWKWKLDPEGRMDGKEVCQSSPVPKRVDMERAPLWHIGVISESPSKASGL